MEIALFIATVFGLISVLLSWNLDHLQKKNLQEEKAQEEKIHKLTVLAEIQEKTAYTSDPERAMEIIISYLKDFFDYSTASFVAVKNDTLTFKIYVQEKIGNDYVDAIEKSIVSSLSQFVGQIPVKVNREIVGVSLDDAVKTSYSSSFHIPLIVKNKVVGLIHLSSTKEDLYKDKDMEILRQMIETASSSLANFSDAIDIERDGLKCLVGGINDGILMADNASNLLLINDSAKKILGFIKNDVNFLDVANSFSQNLDLASKINEVVMNHKPFAEKSIQVQDRIIDVFINPIEKNKVSIVLHDMTEYKKKEVAKEDLIHIMVHELRSPITTIKDSAGLIISTKTLEESKKIKFLEIIHQQAKKILEQIGLILDSGKLDAGKLALFKTKGDIAKIIESEMQTFAPQAERKHISLTFNTLSRTLPLISFDPIRITQIIDNLLSNSLKFTKDNGKIKVEIGYKTIPPTLDGLSPMKNVLSLDKQIVVSVSDNGLGIDKEQQKLLFSKYTQAKNSPQLTKAGTGLGLYLVKGIVESHGGRVWVKSAPEEGTTISFTLPATDDGEKKYDVPISKSAGSPLSKLSQTIK